VLIGNGATGVLVTTAGTAGQVLTSNGASADPTFQAPAAAGVTSITGTANQVIASGPTGAVTLSTPQDIHTGASPAFASLTLTGSLTLANNNYVRGADTAATAISLMALRSDNTCCVGVQTAIASNGHLRLFAANAEVIRIFAAGRVAIGGTSDDGVTLLQVAGGMTLSTALGVASGGTGRATLAAHGVLIGNGTTGVLVTTAGTAGQVLTSNGASADPTFQALPAGGGVTSITGTANQVIASGSTGAVTLSLPQSIHTGAAVTFDSLVLSSALQMPNGTSVQFKDTAGTLIEVVKARSDNTVCIGWASAAPTSNGHLRLFAANAEAVRIFPSGRVAIGTTSDDGVTLVQVAGGMTISGSLKVGATAPSVSTGDVAASRSSTTGVVYLGSDGAGYLFRDTSTTMDLGGMAGLKMNGTKVLGAQGAAVADVTIATTQTAAATYGVNEQVMLGNLKTDVTSLKTQLNLLLSRVRTHGLIA